MFSVNAIKLDKMSKINPLETDNPNEFSLSLLDLTSIWIWENELYSFGRFSSIGSNTIAYG